MNNKILNNIKINLNRFIDDNNWKDWKIEFVNDTFKLVNKLTHFTYAKWKLGDYYNNYDFVKEKIENFLKWMDDMLII